MSFEAIKDLVEKIKDDHHKYLYEMCKKECGTSGFLNIQQIEIIFGEKSSERKSPETHNSKTNSAETNSAETISSKTENNNEDLFSLSHEKLLKLTVPELKAYSKKFGLKVTGKRDEILNRLIFFKNNRDDMKKEVKKKPKKSPENKLLSKIQTDMSNLTIRRNKFGNYMHEETNLVFDKESKLVIGMQTEDGKINKLTIADIENCNKYNFEYSMPDNLEENSDSLKDVKVNELDEEFTEEELKVAEESDEDEFEEFYEDDE